MEGAAFPANVATDLALIKDQGKSVGQKPDHGEHHKRRGLMNGGMFEVAVGGDGLKDLGVDSPATAAELMDEQRRDRAKVEISGVEVGALLRHGNLALGSAIIFFRDRDAAQGLNTNGFDNPNQTIRDRPVNLRWVPAADFPVRFGVNLCGRSL